MITPELRKQREEEEKLKEIVRTGIDMRMSGQIDKARAKVYWQTHLPDVPLEVLAEVLAYHLPTVQGIEHALMKKLLSTKKPRTSGALL